MDKTSVGALNLEEGLTTDGDDPFPSLPLREDKTLGLILVRQRLDSVMGVDSMYSKMDKRTLALFVVSQVATAHTILAQ